MAIRWLLMDVGGVLEVVDDATWPARHRARWAAALGLTSDEADRRIEAAALPDIRTGPGVEEYWAGWAAALGASPEQLAAAREEFWDAYCGTGDEPLLALLRGLRGRVGLAILSNSADGAREEEERRYGFATLFDPIGYSHELGVQKPDPAAFTRMLAAMGAAPEEVLLVDDAPANVDAARALGLDAHLHRDTAETIARIRAAVA